VSPPAAYHRQQPRGSRCLDARTAVVRAPIDLKLVALKRKEFIDKVTGHPLSSEAAEMVIATRLG